MSQEGLRVCQGCAFWKGAENLAPLRLEQGPTRSEEAWVFEMAINGVSHQLQPGSRGTSDNGAPQGSTGWALWGAKYRHQSKPIGVYLEVHEENVLPEDRTQLGWSLKHRVLSIRDGETLDLTLQLPSHLQANRRQDLCRM